MCKNFCFFVFGFQDEANDFPAAVWSRAELLWCSGINICHPHTFSGLLFPQLCNLHPKSQNTGATDSKKDGCIQCHPTHWFDLWSLEVSVFALSYSHCKATHWLTNDSKPQGRLEMSDRAHKVSAEVREQELKAVSHRRLCSAKSLCRHNSRPLVAFRKIAGFGCLSSGFTGSYIHL